MIVDLVRIGTRDGYFLDGILQRPEKDNGEAICFIHGTGGNFYSSTLFDFLAQKFLARGFSVLRANTRGHDGISTAVTSKGGVRLGAAYEVVDDCRHDLVALADWLRVNVGPRVWFLGHSLGAVKCLYATAHETTLAPTRLILLSPPRLSYEWFCSSTRKDEFLATYRRAEELVERNQPLALMEVTIPLPFVITAAGYVEKYGPEERYNFLKSLPPLSVPSLFLFGEKEVDGNVAFQGSPGLIEERKAKRANLAVVGGGDHFYSGVREMAWEAIEGWLGGGSP